MAPTKQKEARQRSTVDIYRIKVTLRHIKPPVWRRIEVPGDIRLGRLHEVLQIAMGWTNSHLHAFRVGRDSYGVLDPDLPSDLENERTVRLDKLADEGETVRYEYDFGDGWEHDLKIEKIFPAEPDVHYPRCTHGKRACPPEDCGGPAGYAHLLEVLLDPKHEEHEEHEEMLEWLGDDFDPERFDMREINEVLAGA